MGLPAYALQWRIDATPAELGRPYRGLSLTYYAAKIWAEGGYNFTGNKSPQPMIPIIGYWDDHDKVPWMLPQVYDYMEGWDTVERENPMVQESYNLCCYLTCYGKMQNSDFVSIHIDRNGEPDSYTDGVMVGNGTITLSSNDGTAEYNFNIAQSGVYDIAVNICFLFWDKNNINISLDGNEKTFTEKCLWWAYWRKTCWLILAKG